MARRRAMAPAAAVILVLAVFGLAGGCGSGEGRPRVVVAAASDLRFAFEEIEPLFEEVCECDLVFSFGSSGLLSTQIGQGWDADVFASADSTYVDALDRQGLLQSETRQPYAIGRIVLALPRSSTLQALSLEDLTGQEFRTIAIANPEHAPYGRAAQQALESAGVWDVVRGRLVLGENASLATQFVESSNVEAGIVPLSLAIQRQERLRYVLIDDSNHEPLLQVAAVTARGGQPALGRAFLEYLRGDEGRRIMEAYGFALPAGSGER